MKKKLLFRKLLVACCFVAVSTQAQQQLDCNNNLKQALFYLKGDATIKKDVNKSIEYLKPCASKGDAKAQLLLGRIYLTQKDESKYSKAFELIKASANSGYALAQGDLGVLYKYGYGCKLNYNKAITWFKKAANAGDSKAAYSLGYMYLKGLGNVTQDYTQAIYWFEKSKYPMATYWLGYCYYHGYGVSKDIAKANHLLDTNFAITSTESTTTTTNNNANSSISTTALSTNATEATEIAVTDDNLLGVWTGSLLKMDWSGKHIEEKIPFQLTYTVKEGEDLPSLILKLNDQTFNIDYKKYDNELYFDNLTVTLPHTSFRKDIPTKVPYELLSSELNLKAFNGKQFLVGTMDSYITAWSESGAPLRFVLEKKASFTNTDTTLSDEALAALAQQNNRFIKLYPNPFSKDLIVSYKLETTGTVSVKLSDLNGNFSKVLEASKSQAKGEYRYYVNGSSLQKGLYIVTVMVNGVKKTRIVIKK